MGKPAGVTEESIESGHLYRLVPNWPGYWDYSSGLPEHRAFRKDRDGGVSMIIREKLSIPQIFDRKPLVADFAVCEFSVEELVQADGVWVKPVWDEIWGDAHVNVMGITKRRVEWLRELATKNIVRRPGPEKPDDRVTVVDS